LTVRQQKRLILPDDLLLKFREEAEDAVWKETKAPEDRYSQA